MPSSTQWDTLGWRFETLLFTFSVALSGWLLWDFHSMRNDTSIICQTERQTERRPAVSELCVTFHSSSSTGPSLSACNCQAAALLEPHRRWNTCAPVVAVVYLNTLRPVAQFQYNNFGPFYSLLQNYRPAVILINSGEGKRFFRTEDDFHSHSQCFTIHSFN